MGRADHDRLVIQVMRMRRMDDCDGFNCTGGWRMSLYKVEMTMRVKDFIEQRNAFIESRLDVG